MTCNQGTSEKPIKKFYSLLLKGPSINIDMMGGQNRRFHNIEISVLNFDMMTGGQNRRFHHIDINGRLQSAIRT